MTKNPQRAIGPLLMYDVWKVLHECPLLVDYPLLVTAEDERGNTLCLLR